MAHLSVTGKGQVTLRRELLRHLGVQPGQQIEAFIGHLAGRSPKVASLEEIQAAAAAGWAGEP